MMNEDVSVNDIDVLLMMIVVTLIMVIMTIMNNDADVSQNKDDDVDDNIVVDAAVVFISTSGTSASRFRMDENTGILYTADVFNYDTPDNDQSFGSLLLTATDSAGNSDTANLVVCMLSTIV